MVTCENYFYHFSPKFKGKIKNRRMKSCSVEYGEQFPPVRFNQALKIKKLEIFYFRDLSQLPTREYALPVEEKLSEVTL